MNTGFPCRYRGCTNPVEAIDHACEYCKHHCTRGWFFQNLTKLFKYARTLLDGYPKEEL